MQSEIIIVSGLPRSGTSLMMQMLENGGVEIITDKLRAADIDNPRGYFEFEKAKSIERDKSWLYETRGRAFKMVSQLLYHLPQSESYRIIFMERDLDEVLVSQEKMLQRLDRKAVPREQMKRSYGIHLERLREWLGGQRNIAVLYVNYNDLVQAPERSSEVVNQFLGGRLTIIKMARTVDSSLYRNRLTCAPTDDR